MSSDQDAAAEESPNNSDAEKKAATPKRKEVKSTYAGWGFGDFYMKQRQAEKERKQKVQEARSNLGHHRAASSQHDNAQKDSDAKKAVKNRTWGKLKYAGYDKTMSIKRLHDTSFVPSAAETAVKSESSSKAWGRMKYAGYENVMHVTHTSVSKETTQESHKKSDASKAWGKMKYAGYDQTMDIKRQHDASLGTPAGAKPKKTDSNTNWGRLKYAGYEHVMNEAVHSHEDHPPQRNDDVPVIRAKAGTSFGANTRTVGKATEDLTDEEYLPETTDNRSVEDVHTFDNYKSTLNVARSNHEMKQELVVDETAKWVRSDKDVEVDDGFDAENVVVTGDEDNDEIEAPPEDEEYDENGVVAEDEEAAAETLNVARSNHEIKQEVVVDETAKWVRSDKDVEMDDGFDAENVVVTEDEDNDEIETPPEDEEYDENDVIAKDEDMKKKEAVAEEMEAAAVDEKHVEDEVVAEDEEHEEKEAIVEEMVTAAEDKEYEEKEAVVEEMEAAAEDEEKEAVAEKMEAAVQDEKHEENEVDAEDEKGEIIIENDKDDVVVEDKIAEEAGGSENEAEALRQKHDVTEDGVGGDNKRDVIEEKDISDVKISDNIEEIKSDTKEIPLDERKIDVEQVENGIASPIQCDREMTNDKDIATPGEHEYNDNDTSGPGEEETENDTQRPISTEDAKIVNSTVDGEPVVIPDDGKKQKEENISPATISDEILPSDTKDKAIANVSKDHESKPTSPVKRPEIENNCIEGFLPDPPTKTSHRSSICSVDTADEGYTNDGAIIAGISQFIDETDNDGVVLSSLIKNLSLNEGEMHSALSDEEDDVSHDESDDEDHTDIIVNEVLTLIEAAKDKQAVRRSVLETCMSKKKLFASIELDAETLPE
eukprot:CAMPEP_0172486550 /NCGR_PEP_ID=MMETSP1066-20121228/15170_1 /TAXON_ID=671091 /ORGANISM="Coscinodiscus wailesii, Strain CCMP2513" /LENGTH=880 /DNA_ID=CAMNT_0013252577 /DNA_START=159 /DNA_END=2802 /DNA_ORIENTATION=+